MSDDIETEVGIMDYAFNNKPIQFKNAFNDAMTSKIADVIDYKYNEMFALANGEEVEPDYEVDEDGIEDVEINFDPDEEEQELVYDDEEPELESDEDV